MTLFATTFLLLLSALVSCHGLDTMLTAGFSATHRATGNLFTMKNKAESSISIKRFDINMGGTNEPNPAPVEVWAASGVDPGRKTSTFVYTKILEDTVEYAGKDKCLIFANLTMMSDSQYNNNLTFNGAQARTMSRCYPIWRTPSSSQLAQVIRFTSPWQMQLLVLC